MTDIIYQRSRICKREKGREETPLSLDLNPYYNLCVAVYRQAIRDADAGYEGAFDFLMRDPYGILDEEMKGGLIKRYASKRNFF